MKKITVKTDREEIVLSVILPDTFDDMPGECKEYLETNLKISIDCLLIVLLIPGLVPLYFSCQRDVAVYLRKLQEQEQQ